MDMSCIAVSVIERGQKKLLLILKFLAMALMWYIAPVASGYIAEQLLNICGDVSGSTDNDI